MRSGRFASVISEPFPAIFPVGFPPMNRQLPSIQTLFLALVFIPCLTSAAMAHDPDGWGKAALITLPTTAIGTFVPILLMAVHVSRRFPGDTLAALATRMGIVVVGLLVAGVAFILLLKPVFDLVYEVFF